MPLNIMYTTCKLECIEVSSSLGNAGNCGVSPLSNSSALSVMASIESNTGPTTWGYCEEMWIFS